MTFNKRRKPLVSNDNNKTPVQLSQRAKVISQSLLQPCTGSGSMAMRRRGSHPNQEVRCLTLSKEQLNVYLPPTLPHDQAVRVVENVLEVC